MSSPKLHEKDGKVLVNGEFLDRIGKKYGSALAQIPYGYRLYPDMTGLNETFFIKHDPVEELGKGNCWLVRTQPDRKEVFAGIASEILNEKKAMREMNKEASKPSGLYGYTRKIQAMCESAEKRIQRKAGSLIRKAYRKNEQIPEFLAVHAKRANSVSAKILLKAFKEGLPKLASDEHEHDEDCHCGGECESCKMAEALRAKAARLEKLATSLDLFRSKLKQEFEKKGWTISAENMDKTLAACGAGPGQPSRNELLSAFKAMQKDGTIIRQGSEKNGKYVWKASERTKSAMATPRMYSLYGFPTKTAELGLQLCNDLRIEAGHIAADLHQRQASMYDGITGFLTEHSKTARSGAAKLLLACYPEQRMFKSASVDAWLTLDPEF